MLLHGINIDDYTTSQWCSHDYSGVVMTTPPQWCIYDYTTSHSGVV
jgi:hypothetical protein